METIDSDVKTSITNSLLYIRGIIGSANPSNPDEISDNEMIILLKWISTITEGNKLYVKSLEITTNTVFTQLYRTFIKTESRSDTLQFLYYIENESLKLINKYIQLINKADITKRLLINQQTKMLVNAIILSLDGVIALKKTYIEDKMFCCFIDNLIENTIHSKLLELKCTNLFDFASSIDLESILNKIKIKEDKIIDNKNIEKDKNIEKEIKVIEQNDKKFIENEQKIVKKEINEKYYNKEFQISTELKDFKKSEKSEKSEEADYDNDCFDQLEEEEQLEDL
jgi:hypothetical protein